MKIRVIASDGSPIGVSVDSIYGKDPTRPKGVGGSELGILTLMEEWHKQGHEVIFFNDPSSHSKSPFEHRAIKTYEPRESSDVDIIFRTPNYRVYNSKALKVWFSHDQYTSVDFTGFQKAVDKVVCISPFHQGHFSSIYGIDDTVSIELPVRVKDYEKDIEKIPFRCIFTSVPDRGLHILLPAWLKIKAKVPEASLVITSDYRLWGVHTANNENYRKMFLGKQDVRFLGAVVRDKLIEEQLQACCLTYPCVYDELYCYSISEAQVAGAVPVTSEFGACKTTNQHITIPGDPREIGWEDKFVAEVEKVLSSEQNVRKIRSLALERFSPEVILKQWDEKVFK